MPGLGLHIGPHFPERQSKFKEAKAKRKKMKSRAKAEKERKKKRPERQKRKADKVKRRAQKKEEERLKRAERGEPEVIKVKKSATNSHHGTEQIDSTILKLLRKSHRSKKEVPHKKEKKVGRPEVASQWRGVREERHEARQEKKQREKLKPNEIYQSKDYQDKTEHLEEKKKKCSSTFSEAAKDPVEEKLPRADIHYALPGSGQEAAELASPLPDQNPLDPEAFCMKFFQVIKKQSCIIKFI